MKREAFLICICAVVVLAFSGATADKSKKELADGTYRAESRAKYVYEPYWGECSMTVEKGQIAAFDFSIIDKSCNQVFDKDYEKRFAGNQVYINQCRNDLKGLQSYMAEFSKTKDLDSIDAISGATWSYNIFKDTVAKALAQAIKE